MEPVHDGFPFLQPSLEGQLAEAQVDLDAFAHDLVFAGVQGLAADGPFVVAVEYRFDHGSGFLADNGVADVHGSAR